MKKILLSISVTLFLVSFSSLSYAEINDQPIQTLGKVDTGH